MKTLRFKLKNKFFSVGSFVWTHLTNLQETSVPSKIEIQSLLSNRKFEEKFKSDFRKFSKNIEFSGFYDPLNVGKKKFKHLSI